jgi:hypothetical protein
MPSSQSPPALSFQPHERMPPLNVNTPSPSLSFSGTPLIDPLLIDNLAQDFNLEPTQRANLHAFVTVSNNQHAVMVWTWFIVISMEMGLFLVLNLLIPDIHC